MSENIVYQHLRNIADSLGIKYRCTQQECNFIKLNTQEIYPK